MPTPTNDAELDLFPVGIPLPPDPGGEHSHHLVQDESGWAYTNYLRCAGEREAKLLVYLNGCGWGGSTDDEGWRALGFDTPNSYAPCRNALKKAGAAVWTGEHRMTKAGNLAKVWVTADIWIRHHRKGF